jgi:hypothetical protein
VHADPTVPIAWWPTQRRRGSAHPRLVRVARERDARRRPDPRHDVGLGHAPRRLQQQVAGGGGDPAAQHDHVGIEGVDGVGDADADPLAQDAQALQRAFVALVGELDRLLAVLQAALLRERVQATSRAERLERRGLGRTRLRGGRAGRQVRGHDLVPELGGRPGRAAVDAPVDHDAAADARPDSEHHEMAGDEGAIVRVGLGQGRAVGVVVDVDRDAEPLAQQVAQRDAGERDVHAEAGGAGGEVDRARDGDPDGVGSTCRADGGHELLEELLLVVAVGGPAADLRQPRPLEDCDGDLRAADVHTDESLSHVGFLSDSA